MKTNNSFAKIVKEEIISREYKDERLLSILSGFIRDNGVLRIRNKKDIIVVQIDNPKIAKFIYLSVAKIFNEKPQIQHLKKRKLNKDVSFVINITNPVLINKLHIHLIDNEIDKYFYQNSERIGGYLAGTFLASGSVNSPKSSNYHLEASFNDEEYAKSVIELAKKYEATTFNIKTTQRRDRHVIYLKRSDQIVDFLALIGATNACLDFENTRIDRDVMNVTNRLKNLDTANYEKTIKASKNDIKIINKLIKKKGLANLGSEKVILLASLRVKYPEDTLEDLAEKMSEELHTDVSKSNINHILRAFRLEGRNL